MTPSQNIIKGSSSSMMRTFNNSMLRIFFLFGAIGPLPSIILYVFFPSGTVEYFNGKPSSTANFWCSVNGSADATISFLCLSALLTDNVEIKKLVLRAFAIYAVFHWGAFWWWSSHGEHPHPLAMVIGYPISIAISLAAMLWWSFLRPPRGQYYPDHPDQYENI